MTHHRGEHRGAQSPQGLVAHHRAAIADKSFEHIQAGQQHQSGLHPEEFCRKQMHHHDDQFRTSGDEGGQGRTAHSQGGRAQIAENKHPVQEGVQRHGYHQNIQTQLRALHTAIGRDIHHGQRRKDIGQPGQLAVLGGQRNDLPLVAEQA